MSKSPLSVRPLFIKTLSLIQFQVTFANLHESLRGGRAVAAARHGERDGGGGRQRGAAHAQRGVQRARAAAAAAGPHLVLLEVTFMLSRGFS